MRRATLHFPGVLALVFALSIAWSQPLAPARIGGQVTDPAGSSIPGAQISLRDAGGVVRSANTDLRGEYRFVDVVPGIYTVQVSAKGFATAERLQYLVKSGEAQVLNFPLVLASETQTVTVQDTVKVDPDPSSNADALVLRGKELDARPRWFREAEEITPLGIGASNSN